MRVKERGESPGGRPTAPPNTARNQTIPPKMSGQVAGLLGGEIQRLLQVESQGSERGIVRKPLKNLADIGDPEGTLEAGANFAEAFGKIQHGSSDAGTGLAWTQRFCTSSADSPATRITFLRLLWPDVMVIEERGRFKRFARNSMQASLAWPSRAARSTIV